MSTPRAATLAAIAWLLCSAAAAASPDDPLLLEIWINGHSDHIVATVAKRGGELWAKASDLQAAGVKVMPQEKTTDGLVAVTSLSGVTAKIVDTEQKLEIAAVKNRLAPQVFDLRAIPPQTQSTSAYGFIGAYNLAATVDNLGHLGNTSGIGAELGGTFFSPWATLTGNGIFEDDPGFSQATRLDTTLEFDQPGSLRAWLIGDAISGNLDWSRPVRFAGFQVATDFTLRPDLVTMPLPAFFGDAAVPSTVDVFVNAARVFETGMDQGPFEIDNIPVVTGSGQASIVVRDALGQETAVQLPYFASDALLQKGLSAYDFDAGFLRREYGINSFDYADPLAMGTWRYGLTNYLTIETHAEASQDTQLVGAGMAFFLGAYGVAQFDAAQSTSDQNGQRRGGTLVSASVSSQWRQFGAFGSVVATSGHYDDIASLDALPPPKLQFQAGGNVNLGHAGSLGIAWINIERDGETPSRLASASYSLSLADRWYFGTTGFYDCVNKVWAAELFLSIALDNGALAQASVRTGTHDDEVQAGVIKGADPDGGFGYRLTAATGDLDIDEAEATWIGPHGSIDAGLSSVNGQLSGRVLATGAVVAMDGGVYATQVPNGAVALVHAGEPGARIYRENREVAVADDDGDALITNLQPYAENRISVDPQDYKMTAILDTTQKTAVPRRRSGVIVDLAPIAHHPAVVVLAFADGTAPQPGSRVALDDGGAPLVVGRGGEIFFGDLDRPQHGAVQLGHGICRFSVSPPAVPKTDTIPTLGPVLCTKDPAT
ncbi:MAG TPA: fimbria/pilus outer membrane usher protein [Rhizomicrobium sp.]|jgi:outer membrane usher protein|nr:fimbria/pilus outer membrane usher protein [Rhizomicrobium sp.]